MVYLLYLPHLFEKSIGYCLGSMYGILYYTYRWLDFYGKRRNKVGPYDRYKWSEINV